jgi:hypothetical protein
MNDLRTSLSICRMLAAFVCRPQSKPSNVEHGQGAKLYCVVVISSISCILATPAAPNAEIVVARGGRPRPEESGEALARSYGQGVRSSTCR